MKYLITTILTLALGQAALAMGVTHERVTFRSGDATLIGDLYRPQTATTSDPADAVVVTGAWMTIKEQMSGTYARALAEQGYVALAFDFRTWGESSGHTRSLENPAMKIADIQAAAAFLDAHPLVDNVHGLGICASAGYMVYAAAESGDIASVALVAPWLHDAAIVDAVYGGAAGVNGLVELGKSAALTEVTTGEPTLVPAAGPVGSNAVMQGASYYVDPALGAIPEWENTFNVASWEGWLTFDALAPAAAFDKPILLVHSEAAAIPQGAHQFLALAGDNAEGLWLDDVNQFAFYHEPSAVAMSSRAAARFFR